MRTSTQLVSLRTYALAFAVALSPAVMQTSGSCNPKTGDTTLTQLEMEVQGQNHISNFDPAQRMYYAWLPLAADMALVRACSTDPESQMTYDLRVDGAAIEYGSFPRGGGEITLAPIPEGPGTAVEHCRSEAMGSGAREQNRLGGLLKKALTERAEKVKLCRALVEVERNAAELRRVLVQLVRSR